MHIPKDDKEQQAWMLDLLINHYGVGGHVIDPANHLNLKDLARLKTHCGQENRDTVDFVSTWIELPTQNTPISQLYYSRGFYVNLLACNTLAGLLSETNQALLQFRPSAGFPHECLERHLRSE
jgi:hypothetical protein